MANQNEDGTFRWQFVGYVFDEAKWQLSQNERLIDIEAKPLSVLAYLLRNAGRVVTKDELLECAWPGRVAKALPGVTATPRRAAAVVKASDRHGSGNSSHR